MIMVGAMAATLWGIGIAMKAPYHARWTMLAILLVGVMVVHVVLPDGHPFWSHPRVTVTPHIASATRPETAARVVAANIARGERGEALVGLVDRTQGY